MRRGTVSITILHDRNATVAHAVFVADDNLLYEATGSAKREPGDVDNTGIGTALAVGRALAKISRRMIRDGNEMVGEATIQQTLQAKRRHRKNGKARKVKTGKMLSLDFIREEWGPKAAERAAARRQHSI